jgi:hypothetical protein
MLTFFEFNNIDYVVDIADNHNHILVPTGELLHVTAWLESIPLQPVFEQVAFDAAIPCSIAERGDFRSHSFI